MSSLHDAKLFYVIVMNYATHMMNAMNVVLQDCILSIIMSFLNNITMIGSLDECKEKTRDQMNC